MWDFDKLDPYTAKETRVYDITAKYTSTNYSWAVSTTQSSQSIDSDLNRYYVGLNGYRSQISFTATVDCTGIILSVTCDDEDGDYRYVRAFLSDVDTSSISPSSPTSVSAIASIPSDNQLDVSYNYDGRDNTNVAYPDFDEETMTTYFMFQGDFKKDTTYYIYILSYGSPYGESWANVSSVSTSSVYMRIRNNPNYTQVHLYSGVGTVQIDNGSSFNAYEVYIDNGSKFELYEPYIDNGTEFTPCG